MIKQLKNNQDLTSLDNDLRYLFRSWFNPGFLKLEKITWETKAAILEKIIKYERVHHIKDMNDLKIAEAKTMKKYDQGDFLYNILSTLREKVNAPTRRKKK